MEAAEKSSNVIVVEWGHAHTAWPTGGTSAHILHKACTSSSLLFLFSQNFMFSKESNPSLQTLQLNDFFSDGMLAKSVVASPSSVDAVPLKGPAAGDQGQGPDSSVWRPRMPSPALLTLLGNCCSCGLLHPTRFWDIRYFRKCCQVN